MHESVSNNSVVGGEVTMKDDFDYGFSCGPDRHAPGDIPLPGPSFRGSFYIHHFAGSTTPKP